MASFKLFDKKNNNNFALISERIKPNITEKIKGVVENPEAKGVGSKIGVEHPFDWELLESAYLSVPLIQGAIDKHVDFVLGSEYKIDSDNDKLKKKFDEFVRNTDFNVLLRLVVRNMLIYGSAFLEVVWSGKRVKQLKILDSKTMYVKRDNRGKLLGYSQVLNSKTIGFKSEPVNFKPDEVIHFSFNNIGSSPYGTSAIKSLFGDGNVSIVRQFLSMEQAMKSLLDKQVNAKLHIQVGDENNHPTQTDINDLASKLEASKNDTEWITSYLVKMNILGYEGKILDLQPFIEHYEDQMVYGLQTPFVLLGKGRVPEGLASVQLEAFERRINSIQLTIAHELENKIFDEMFGNVEYTFVWNRHENKELKELDTLIRFLAEKFKLSEETRFIIENRIRNILGSMSLDYNDYIKAFERESERKAKEMKQLQVANGGLNAPNGSVGKPKSNNQGDGKDDAE